MHRCAALLERHGDAGERAAGADRADEAVDLAAGLVPDLGPGRLVMRAAVGEIVELVGPDRAVRLLRRHFLRQRLGIAHVVHRIGIRHRGHEPQIGAAQAQHVLLFLALRLGHDDDAAVAERVADQRQPDPGVAGGALDDDAARAQQAALLRVLDDEERGAVLDRAAGIEELGLAQDRAAGLFRGAAQPDQRRIADGFDEAVANLHAPDYREARFWIKREGVLRLRVPRAARDAPLRLRNVVDGLKKNPHPERSP